MNQVEETKMQPSATIISGLGPTITPFPSSFTGVKVILKFLLVEFLIFYYFPFSIL